MEVHNGFSSLLLVLMIAKAFTCFWMDISAGMVPPGQEGISAGMAEEGMSQAPEARPSPPSVYHERQRLELCAVHALNNVLQEQLFSQEAADEICKR